LTGLAVVLAFTPFVRAWALQRKFLDRSTQFHSGHTRLVPRFGGAALFLAFSLLFLLIRLGVDRHAIPAESSVIFWTCLAMFILGLWDDLRSIDARVKLLIQIGIAFWAFKGGLQVGRFQNPFTHQIHLMGWLDGPVTVLWLIGVTNLVNLVDGIDGLAAGLVLVLMILLAIVSASAGSVFSLLIAMGMCGATSAFLFFNFPPARIFMGDGGAYFLGLLIAEMALFNSNKGTIAAALTVPFFALGIPIIDTSFAIIRRFLIGLPLFRADRRHIHHRLVAMGFSQRHVVLLLYGGCAFFALLGLAVLIQNGRLLPILFGVFMLAMLLSARVFGFVSGWYKLGRVLTDSVMRRKQTRYALLLGQLLEMDAERCATMEDLWKEFGLLVGRLRMQGVEWHRGDEVWRYGRASGSDLFVVDHTFRNETGEKMLFSCATDQWEFETFRLLTELATESWLRAAHRWEHLQKA